MPPLSCVSSYRGDVGLKDQLFRFGTGVHRAVFRASRGRILGRAGGMPVLILTTTGRRTGRRRQTMLTTPVHDDQRIVLVASYGGDPRHPAWYRNLVDHPEVTVTIGGRERTMRARVAGAEERAELWPQIVGAYRGYDAYRQRTEREIPVVVLESYIGAAGPSDA
jgi:deazaflavin-dependent oxidoreductase (nitroreductase family)